MSIVALQLVAWAQTDEFPAPVASGTLGVRDSGALAEIRGHLLTTAGSGWTDLQARGTLTLPNGETHSASLYLLGSEFARLDIEMNSGTRSVRISPSSGIFQDEKGSLTFLSPSVSAAGIVALPRTWILGLNSPNASLFDRGTVNWQGKQLHRIGFEYCLTGQKSAATRLTFASDLYFDPATHLLLFSVDNLNFGFQSAKDLLRVINYDDYKSVNGVLFPATIRQQLDGQLEWELQLTDIVTNNNPSTQTFSF